MKKIEKPITHQIYDIIFSLLEKTPKGISWTVLASKIKEMEPNFHPKTINGCIWKLIEKYPDKVYKPEKGIFRLLKYKK
ncbi:MAG: hypothetical protein HGB12_10575 [Bacteroidetes bacterium]|nr:hypothetical protein [Bacteroidota bacterium]